MPPTFKEKMDEIIKGLVIESISAEKVEYIISGTEDGRWHLYSIAPKKPYKKKLLADAQKVWNIFVRIANALNKGIQKCGITPFLANRNIRLFYFNNRESLKHIWLELKNSGSIEIIIQPYPHHWKELRRFLIDAENLIHIFPHFLLKEIIKKQPEILQGIHDDILNIMEIYYPKIDLK